MDNRKMDAIYIADILLLILALTTVAQCDISVHTKAGTFVGFKKDLDVDDRTVEISKFLGIPYAEPPTGDLRFRKSVLKAALADPLVTQKYGPECVQLNFFPTEAGTSEDCLYLNVYAPALEKDGDKKAVMVWIHGGGFFCGSANIYVSDMLAATGDVIVVTINYRVSALGFLNIGDSNAPGNYGLWDQHLAIQWVHDNIEAFGGDVGRVTIFGESAGSASVIYQGLYPGNKGLFQRIIAQSGSAASPWATTQHAEEEAKELAAIVDCERDNNEEMMKCLRTVPVDKIETAINSELLRHPFPFMPSVDGEFVKVNPRVIFDTEADVASEERSTLASFDLLTGVNYAEGAAHVSPFTGVEEDPNDFMPSREFFEQSLVPLCIGFTCGKDMPKIVNDLVVAEYTDWADPENPFAIREQFVSMYGDVEFVAPLHATLTCYLNQSKNGPFVYQLTATPDRHLLTIQSWSKKAVHGDDLMYVFGSRKAFESWGAGDGDLTPWEKELSHKFMTMWTNFAKTGNPNKPRDTGIDWIPYTADEHRYLEISDSVAKSSVKERFGEKQANLWNRLVPKLLKSVSHQRMSMYDGTCEKEGNCTP